MKEKKGVEKERRLKVMNKISSWLKDASGKSHYFNSGRSQINWDIRLSE